MHKEMLELRVQGMDRFSEENTCQGRVLGTSWPAIHSLYFSKL